jgi:hypothetical protein
MGLCFLQVFFVLSFARTTSSNASKQAFRESTINVTADSLYISIDVYRANMRDLESSRSLCECLSGPSSRVYLSDSFETVDASYLARTA